MRPFLLPTLGICTTCVTLLVGCQSPVAPNLPPPPPPAERTLSFQIAGPSQIDAKGSFTWEAIAFGGSGGYEYQWEVTRQAGSQGTGTTIARRLSLLVTAADGDLLLSLRVTSGTQSKAQSLRVRNCIGGCAATP